MDNIERLYKCYEILSESLDNVQKNEEEYKEILEAVKGSTKEKMLATQFIGKFFKYFPDLANKAIDAQLDLCEDEDIQIRRQAIKNLPLFCKDTKEHTPRIGDTLSQLLVLDDPLELQQVHFALQTILKTDAKGALAGMFGQIASGDEVTREKTFKFLSTKVFNLGSTVVTKEIEEFIISEIKRLLQDVTSEEFQLCMNILRCTKLGSTVTGHVELVNLAVEQAELGADIDAITIEDEVVERFIQCASQAMPYFSTQIPSTPFIIFVCDKLLPLSTWNMIAPTEQGQTQLRLLKVFAEMCTYTGTLENASERIEAVYKILREYMPLPVLDEIEILKNPPSFQFSHAECLLYALHSLGKKHPDKLNFISDPDSLKDFRSRLQFLARGTQGYIKKLEEAVKGKSKEELKSEEDQLKLTALKTTSNINALIRDLFHTPPSFKTEVQLSWVVPRKTKFGQKRHAEITFDSKKKNSPDKKPKAGEQKVYVPPSGKYSAKVQNYSNRNRGFRQQRPKNKF
ncbi:apoptosis inhibitor 5 homolog [Condylostylus longicornis]|uniref:apoptosis inhibitor 5 homolog n=1 Tax=Condylostylus longicornis TaxID=2530218 RepID=UPI00244DC450|nr:apoptosis inhibitor 5 homolog [Condylostylus longicornis]